MTPMETALRLDHETHTYWIGGRQVPGYSQIVRDLGVAPDNPFYTDAGREEGIALHKWVAFLATGKESTTPPDPRIAGRVEGIRKFLRDTGFRVVGAELPQYDPVSGFACTPDIWGFIGAWSWTIDTKRGAKLPTHRLQTAAQVIALRANGFRARKRGALYLRDNDYRLDEHNDIDDEPRWKAIVAAYHAKQFYAKVG